MKKNTNNIPFRTNYVATTQAAASEALVAAMPYNSNKPREHGHDNADAPTAGLTVEPDSLALTAIAAHRHPSRDNA